MKILSAKKQYARRGTLSTGTPAIEEAWIVEVDWGVEHSGDEDHCVEFLLYERSTTKAGFVEDKLTNNTAHYPGYRVQVNKYVSRNFCGNGLTAAEQERLHKLLEELGEVQQVIGKTLLHGWESGRDYGGLTNRERLEEELGDVSWAKGMMTRSGELSEEKIENACVAKLGKFNETGCYLHHQDELRPNQPGT